MNIKISHFIIGVTTGLLLVLFFIGLQANAAELKDLNFDDLEGSSIEKDIVLYNYLGDIVPTYDKDEIFSNGYRVGNRVILYPNTQFIKSGTYWRNFEYATTTLEKWNTEKPLDPFVLLPFIKIVNADTFYTSAGDGHAEYTGSASWSTTRDAGTGTGVSATGHNMYFQVRESSGNFLIRRMFLPFDLSSINFGTHQISSTTLYMTRTSSACVETNDADAYIEIGSSTQDSISTLTTSDYGRIGWSKKMSDRKLDITALTVDTEFNFFFNDTGLEALNNGEGTFFVMTGKEKENTAPGSGLRDQCYFWASEEEGTTLDPYLDIYITELGGGSTSTPEATSTAAQAGTLPIFNDISVISGYIEIYTDSTTTPSEVRYIVYHVPFFVWLVFWLIFSFILGRTMIELIIRLRKK